MTHEFALHQQAGVRVQLPTERGGDEYAFTVDVVAKTVVVLDREVDSRQHITLIIQRRVDVQRGAIAIPTAGAGLQRGEGFGLRFLGDNVHRTARIAATVEAGGRAFEHFDALDIGRIRRARVTAIGAETVLVELRGGEAAHAVFVQRQAAKIVLLRHAAGKLQGAFHVGAAQVREYRGGNHTDGLWDVA